MCGICGYISKQNIEEGALREMTDSMLHRGPDDTGIIQKVFFEKNDHSIGNDWHLGLGQRRLSIIDLSVNAHQPMFDSTGRYLIVFNGEIYNFRELKKELTEYRFTSESDTEVLLYAYVKYGTEAFKKLNGMFAIAIFDFYLNSLTLARDRMGEKPLYYYRKSTDFAFGSELKAIMKFPGFSKTVRREVIGQYFSQNVVLAPNSIFEDVYKLGPGEYLVWKDNSLEKKSYFSVLDEFERGQNDIISDYGECKRKLKELIYDSVSKRLISDVPFGCFLSGGVDSSLISAVAKDINGQIDTFAIGFEDERFNEAPIAKEVSGILGTKHHEMVMSEKELFSVLGDMVKYYDEPFSDSSQLATMLVASFAKKRVTVTLSGDGGDELFAGYSCNDTLNKLRKLEPIINPIRYIVPNSFSEANIDDRFRVLLAKRDAYGKYQYYAQIKEHFAKMILLDKKALGVVRDIRLLRIDDWKQRRALLDMMTYLPDEIMTKTDRASMKYSLETRAPLLDYRIVEHSFRIPMGYKYASGNKKFILKDVLSDFLPMEIVERPKKGFAVPIYRWLNGGLRNQLDKYCEKDRIVKQGIFDFAGISKLIMLFEKSDQTSTTNMVWSFFVFQMWYEEYVGW